MLRDMSYDVELLIVSLSDISPLLRTMAVTNQSVHVCRVKSNCRALTVVTFSRSIFKKYRWHS